MLNSDIDQDSHDATAPDDAAVNSILRSGAVGAIALAGIGAGVVVAIWLAFYLLVFVPRAGAP